MEHRWATPIRQIETTVDHSHTSAARHLLCNAGRQNFNLCWLHWGSLAETQRYRIRSYLGGKPVHPKSYPSKSKHRCILRGRSMLLSVVSSATKRGPSRPNSASSSHVPPTPRH